MGLIVVIVILFLLFGGALPTYGYSRNWGYAPSGVLGTILLVVVILWLINHI